MIVDISNDPVYIIKKNSHILSEIGNEILKTNPTVEVLDLLHDLNKVLSDLEEMIQDV